MAEIEESPFILPPTEDKNCVFGNEQYARLLDIGSTWNDIKIAALVAIDPDGVSNITSASLVLGVCSGKTAPFGAASTTNFIGLRIGAPSTLTYQAGSGNPYWNNSGSGQVHTVRKVATTLTSAAHANISRGLPTSTGAVKRRWPVMVRIVKGSPNYTVYAWVPQGAPSDPSIDFSYTDFVEALEDPTLVNDINVNGIVLEASNAALACDESAGGFDAVNLYWNKLAFPLRNYIIKAYRFS